MAVGPTARINLGYLALSASDLKHHSLGSTCKLSDPSVHGSFHMYCRHVVVLGLCLEPRQGASDSPANGCCSCKASSCNCALRHLRHARQVSSCGAVLILWACRSPCSVYNLVLLRLLACRAARMRLHSLPDWLRPAGPALPGAGLRWPADDNLHCCSAEPSLKPPVSAARLRTAKRRRHSRAPNSGKEVVLTECTQDAASSLLWFARVSGHTLACASLPDSIKSSLFVVSPLPSASSS